MNDSEATGSVKCVSTDDFTSGAMFKRANVNAIKLKNKLRKRFLNV